MNRINNIHNKTTSIAEEDLPYNPSNVLIEATDLRNLFDANGLKGIQFNNINLYRNAFVHKSYCTMKNEDFTTGNERCPPDCLPLQEMSYERLEFLGDAILGMIVARYLYERYPDQAEGFLSRVRTKIVNGKMLGYLSDKIGFPKFAILSKQVEEAHGRNNYKIMEDVFEAFLGAIYMDFQDDPVPLKMPFPLLSGKGYYIAEQWVIHTIETHLDFAELIAQKTHYKDMLVRHMMYAFQDSPRFFEVSVSTVHNVKQFTYCVKDKAGVVLGKGTGATKKDAENTAAKEALLYYGEAI